MELLKLVMSLVLTLPPADQPGVDMGYAFALSSVMREVGGDRTPLKAVTPNGVSDDEVVTIKWAPAAPRGVYVWVINKSAAPLTVEWDEAAYVAPDGNRQRVRHQGGPFQAVDDPQAPTVIPPGAKVADLLVPVQHLYRAAATEPGTGGWRYRPLLPTRVEVGRELDVVNALKGRTLQASLTLSQMAVQRRYTATFAIGDIRAEISGSAVPTDNALAEQPLAAPSTQPTPTPAPSVAAPPPAPSIPVPTPQPTPSRRSEELNNRRDYRRDNL